VRYLRHCGVMRRLEKLTEAFHPTQAERRGARAPRRPPGTAAGQPVTPPLRGGRGAPTTRTIAVSLAGGTPVAVTVAALR
jgi:hypothetical protein